MTRSVCIVFPTGCPRSQVEAARLFEYFAANGWRLNDKYARSDLIVMSGCAVATKQEDASLTAVSVAAKKRRPASRLVVVGCAAGIVDDRLREEFGAIVIPPVRIHELDQIIGAQVPLSDIRDPNHLAPLIRRAGRPLAVNTTSGLRRAIRRVRRARRGLMTRSRSTPREFADLEPLHDVHSIRVAAGCLEECSYCAIRVAVGSLRSKPLDRVIEELDEGLALGRTEFKLIGADVGAYGQDLGSSSAELLTAIFSRTAPFKVTIHDFHPRWLVQYEDVLVPLLADNTDRVRLLILPVQSGSDRVLQRMERRGSAEELARSLQALRSATPGLTLGTHVLVGFPSETEEDFEDSLRLLRLIGFERVDIYRYADRPKTAALSFSDKVSADVKSARVERLLRELPTAREFT